MVLIGHNGAGKTTLMKLMLGLTHPDAGQVQVLGANPATAAAAQRRAIGYLPESVAFHSAMKGREVLAFYARLKGVATTECRSILERVGLEQAADRRVSTYSKGMRQRLGLAQAMLGKPRLLFLDEPTSGLDPTLRRQFYDLIDTLSLSGTTSLTSSHSLNEVEARADRIAIMKTGAIVACGTLSELSQQASLPLVVRLRVAAGHAADIAERLAPVGEVQRLNDHGIDLSCMGASRMVLFRKIAGFGDVIEDMDVVPPRLDDIYNHYMQQVQPQ
ncbi:MAG TPA: ABC transporter ATP-binding protein [Gammaproteobacteria bacterium]|nr:ABC transporter ATP-binding protein [Gammaproteobacteria bacterium]